MRGCVPPGGCFYPGKTTLLTETLTRLKGRADCAVIEGDQQTVNDAARIRATGTPAIQVRECGRRH